MGWLAWRGASGAWASAAAGCVGGASRTAERRVDRLLVGLGRALRLPSQPCRLGCTRPRCAPRLALVFARHRRETVLGCGRTGDPGTPCSAPSSQRARWGRSSSQRARGNQGVKSVRCGPSGHRERRTEKVRSGARAVRSRHAPSRAVRARVAGGEAADARHAPATLRCKTLRGRGGL